MQTPSPYFSVAINSNPGKGEMTVLFGGSSQTTPAHSVGPQVLDYHLVHYVISGTGTFHCMGRSYEVGPGGSFFIFPGDLVSYASDSERPWHYRWIGFKGTIVDQALSVMGISAHHPVAQAQGNRRIPVLFRRIQQVLQSGEPRGDLQTGGYLRLLFGEYAAGRLETDDKPGDSEPDIKRQVDQAIRWLTLQYNRHVSIELMAQTLGYHRTHLSKMFKQYTGMSPMHFLLKLRMDRARELLREPLTVEQVASSVGFADSLYFSKQFKKMFGVSPSEYRTAMQGTTRFDCSR